MRIFLICVIALTGIYDLISQDIIESVGVALIPDDAFYYYIGDIPHSVRNEPMRMLSDYAFQDEDEISGELLDQSQVYWKYYLLPVRDDLNKELERLEISDPVVVVESYETPVSVWYAGRMIDLPVDATGNRLEYHLFNLGRYREREPIFFRIEANPYAGEEVYLTDRTLHEKAARRLPFLYVIQELPVTLFSFFTFLIGVSMLFVYLIKLPRSDRFLLWFGLFSLTFTVYSVFTSHTVNLLFAIPPVVDFYVSLLAQDVMPIFLLLFYLSFSVKAWQPLFIGLVFLQIILLLVRTSVMINGYYWEWSDLLSLATPILYFMVAMAHLVLRQRDNPYGRLFILAFIALGLGYLLQLSGDVFDIFGDIPIFVGSILFFLILSYLPIFSYFRQQTRITEQNVAFARYVPQEFLAILNRGDITEISLGDQIEREFTILFTDIRSFTTISEKMSPSENIRFINDYLSVMVPVIREHRGFVDKYIGDAIMALFPAEPIDAVRCAIHMLERLRVYNQDNLGSVNPAIQIGIGIHTGNTMLGVVGEAERYQGTVISDAVNLASRLEGLTKEMGCPILISSDTVRKLPSTVSLVKMGTVAVKGKTQTTELFTVEVNGDGGHSFS